MPQQGLAAKGKRQPNKAVQEPGSGGIALRRCPCHASGPRARLVNSLGRPARSQTLAAAPKQSPPPPPPPQHAPRQRPRPGPPPAARAPQYMPAGRGTRSCRDLRSRRRSPPPGLPLPPPGAPRTRPAPREKFEGRGMRADEGHAGETHPSEGSPQRPPAFGAAPAQPESGAARPAARGASRRAAPHFVGAAARLEWRRGRRQRVSPRRAVAQLVRNEEVPGFLGRRAGAGRGPGGVGGFSLGWSSHCMPPPPQGGGGYYPPCDCLRPPARARPQPRPRAAPWAGNPAAPRPRAWSRAATK
jgi:hypothetical protein